MKRRVNLSNSIPSSSAIPIFSIKKSTREIRDSISRISTGLKVLGGNDAASHSMATNLAAHAASFKSASSNNQHGIDLLTFVEGALLELTELTTRLRELGLAHDLATNDTADIAGFNAEAVSVSDTIDSIVSSLTFNGINVLGTSSKTFNVGINDAGSTQSIQTTIGIAATSITGANGIENSAATTLGEITQSLGAVAGSYRSLQGYQNVAESSAASLLEAASNLQSTDYAIETAQLTKNSIIQNYAMAMVAQVNNEELKKLKILA